MNPDGVSRGHIRTNAAGENLNRTWADPDPATAPEVCAIAALMDRTGVDFMCDVHGDETTPAVFAVGCEGVPSFSPALDAIQGRFQATLKKMCPEFYAGTDPKYSYGRMAAGRANLAICKNAVAERFNSRYAADAAAAGAPQSRFCLAMTLEMPFWDCEYAPDAAVGWR